jgi:predicted nuclease of predicted toxin-antitoxin system
MKLLFDHNLSHKLVPRLADIFPDSTQTRLLNFGTANDSTIWQYARDYGFVLVTLDKDFSDLALQRGATENHLASMWQFNRN